MVAPTAEHSAQFQASSLLSGIDEEARRAVFDRLVDQTLQVGDDLLTQGKPNDRLWFVLDGTVSIVRDQTGGHVELLASMSGSAIFGTTTFFRWAKPTATIRAASKLYVGTLDREAYEGLRRDQPRVAEGLALAVLRVLSERFDLLDERITELMAEHGHDHSRVNEWANFRSRLFEDPAV